jgi:hypothetical protein
MTYVLWAVSPDGRKNLGEILASKGEESSAPPLEC